MPFVRTPFLLVAAQDDAFQLETDTGSSGPPDLKNPAQAAFVRQFEQRTLALVESLQLRLGPSNRSTAPSKAPKAHHHSVFSPHCFSHSTSLTSSFYSVKVRGSDGSLGTMSSALSAVMDAAAGGAAPPGFWDTCSGFACGPGCSVH
jgi:hypothetical protein